MKHYFENVLKGFKDESKEIKLDQYMRTSPDFLLIDVDQDDMPEILFAFKYGRERYVGVLKRDAGIWRLCNVSNQRVGTENGIFALVNLQEEVCIAPRDIDKAFKIKEIFGDKENAFIGMIDGKIYYGKLESMEDENIPEQIMEEDNISEPMDTTQGEEQVIDFLQGDVSGEGCEDNVYLVGEKKFGENSNFVKNMSIRIESPTCDTKYSFSLPQGSGYAPILFLGDFTGDGMQEILVTYYTAPNGGYTYNYIYKIIDGEPRLIFDSSKFNEAYTGLVQYLDNYKVLVETEKLGKKYWIDISNKDAAYLDQIYTKEGKLIEPKEGEILGIIATNPADFDSNKIYNLSAVQRIIGISPQDTLALLETFFKWVPGNERFEPFMQYVSLIGEDA